MKVVLFGAGASYGSESVSPARPALGMTLFDELQRNYPSAWGALPAIERSKFVPNFELGMKEVWESSSHDGPVLMRCMADYFAKFRAKHNNAYARLLEHLEFHDVLANTVFSSLNYECIFETAARNYGFEAIDYFGESLHDPEVCLVWKIHGSCNFLPMSVSGGAGAVSFSGGAVSWDGEMRIVDPSSVGPFVAQNAFYPAMAVFMKGKPVHSHQSAIAELQNRWQKAVAKADTVGIIGVHPNEADTHIWDHIANTSAKVVIIGDHTANAAFISSRREGKESIIVGDRFARDLPEFATIFAGS